MNRRLALILFGIGAFLLAVLVARTTSVMLLERSRPELALLIDPENGIALARRAVLLASQGDFTPAEALARQSLRNNPIASQPFVVIANAEEEAGNLRQATEIMETALARDPRNLAARLWLLKGYLVNGAYVRAIDQVDALIRLRPRASTALAAALTPLLTTPDARAALVGALSKNPPWQSDFLLRAERDTKDPAAFYDLMGALLRSPTVEIPDETMTLVLNGIINRGDFEIANLLFRQVADSSVEDRTNLVYDGSFRQRKAPPPFNWTLLSTASGMAEMNRDVMGGSSLLSRYYGGEPAVLADQMLVLSPGSYRLAARVQADEMPLDGTFSWRLSCLPSKREVVRLANPPGRREPVNIGTEFTVPSDCRAQQLSLWAESDSGSSMAAARYTLVFIRSLGGQVRP